MRSTLAIAAFVVATIAGRAAISADANALAIEARTFHEAAGLESDADKRLSLLRHARETLERIAAEDPDDLYAKRLESGEPILALTLTGIDKEIAAIEREKKKLTGTAGSYVVLFDAQGKPLASGYWVAPHVISIADSALSQKFAPNEVPNYLIDRYLLSQGLTAPFLFWANAIGYAPLADDFDVPVPGHSFSTTGRVLQKGADADSSDPGKAFTVDFSWQEPTAKVLSGVKLEGTAFNIANAVVFDMDLGRLIPRSYSGIYLPTLGFGFDRAVWDLAQSAVIGRDAASSADFAVILKLADKRLMPAARQCLTDLRAASDYKAYNQAWAALESRNEKTIASGLSDILTEPDGLKPYLALDTKYAVGKRFNECQLK